MKKEEINKLHYHLLSILEEVHRICVLHNLKYSLDFGSLLGAIRHNGFIPWDDDIDISMPYSDYCRFIKLCRKGALSNEFVLQDESTEKHYDNPFCKIRKKKTLFVTKNHKNRQYKELGVFVDIFPYFYVSNRKLKNFYAIQKRNIFLFKLISIKTQPLSSNKSIFDYFRSFILFIIPRKFLFFLFRCNNSSKKSKKMLSAWYFVNKVDIKNKVIDAASFSNLTLHVFDTNKFYIFSDFNLILEKEYNDYMTLPPVKDRITHDPIKLKL